MKALSSKYSISFIVFLMAGCFTVVAQNFQWEWAINGGGMDDLRSRSLEFTDFERITHISTDNQNNFYYQAVFAGGNPVLLGVSLSHFEQQDVVLFSTDCQGNFRWIKEFGNDADIDPTGLSVSGDGSVYSSGQIFPRLNPNSAPSYFDNDYTFPNNNLGVLDPGPHNNYAYLIKYDTNGVFQWIKFPQNGNQDINESGQFQNRELFVGTDGTVHWLVRIGEGTHVDGNVTVPAGTDPLPWMVLRYDPNGNFLGKTDIPFSNNHPYLEMDFAYDPLLNRYLLAANRDNNRDLVFDGVSSPNSTLLASVDAVTGAVLWTQESNYVGNVFIEEIAVGDDSSIYITGGASNVNGDDNFAGYVFDQTSPSGSAANSHFAIALNPDGSLQWGNNGDTNGPKFLAITSNATTVAVGGGMNSLTGWDGILGTSGVPLGDDPAVVLLDRVDGSVQGIYQAEGTASPRDEVTALATDSNGNFIVGGYMRQSLFLNGTPATITKNGGSADFWVAKLATTDCNGVPLSTNENQLDKAHLFPNPTKGWTTVSTTATAQSVTLYDTLGRIVMEQKLDNNNRFNAGELPQGVYLVRVVTDKGVAVTRLVRE